MPYLQWKTREEDVVASAKVPYRLLEEVPELSCTDREPETENMLIQGDNLEALKSLLPFYAGKVKCIFIDPPYNTGNDFTLYDDNLKHSQWLSMMFPRLELLHDLLSRDGSIWVTIDDNEAHYLKVIMDEVFHRSNFIADVVWQKRTSRENRAAIGSAHDTVLVYAKLPAPEWKLFRNKLPPNDKGFSNPDSDTRGLWRSIPFSAQGYREKQMYTVTTPAGNKLKPPKGRCWGATEEVYRRYLRQNIVYFPKAGHGRPRIKLFQGDEEGLVPMTWWPASEFGNTEESKKEILGLFEEEDVFGTPKPELLIKQILRIGSKVDDLILDSFLGSGTTAAVAQKMGRRYIGIEMGDHAVTHCAPRLRKVIEGEQGGISKAVGWQGGGGFRFYRLGAAVFDDSTGAIAGGIGFRQLAAHIWYSETRTAFPAHAEGAGDSPLLGVHEGGAIYLLYNGVLGDRRAAFGNVLTHKLLRELPPAPVGAKSRLVYGEACRIGPAERKALGITFKQTPYDVRGR